MSEFQVIQAAVEKTARRRRWERAWRGLWRGLLVGVVGWLIVLALYKVLPWSPWTPLAAGGFTLLSMVAGFIVGGWRKVPPRETARWIDARQQLKERLSTALEFTPRSDEDEWSQLIVHDASEHVHGLDPRRLIPFHLPRSTRWALVGLAVAAGLGFVPEYRSKAFLQKQNDAANIRNVGRQLAELTRRNLETHPPVLEPTQKALTSVSELGQQLEKVPLTRSEAVRELANAAEKLRQQAEQLAQTPALKPLERAARESSSNSGQNPAALQRQIDALKKSLGNDKATPAALDKLQAALDKARQDASRLSDTNSAASQALRQQIAQSLAALAQDARDMGHPVESLEAALAALEKGQISQVLQNLDVATEDLAKLQQQAKALAKMQQQASKTGQDLAEQLNYGQTDAANQTLQKMIQQLKSANLSSEQLNKILNEVSKALDPAGQYGKVADYLNKAVRQMQQAQQAGDPSGKSKAGASQSLADAAKELQKQAQQMGDMQSLAATMDALSRAEQAIASGQGWGQGGQCPYCNGKGCAACKGTGWKHGGGLKSGGVGTWADEEEGWTCTIRTRLPNARR